MQTRHVLTFVIFAPFSSICFPKLNLFYLIGISVLFAIEIEFAQELLTAGTRNFSWSDIVYDLIGISTGVIISITIREKIKHSKTTIE